jgi:hypothetical protein
VQHVKQIYKYKNYLLQKLSEKFLFSFDILHHTLIYTNKCLTCSNDTDGVHTCYDSEMRINKNVNKEMFKNHLQKVKKKKLQNSLSELLVFIPI